MRAWLDQHEPFDENVPGLRSLSTGVTAKDGDGVNPDMVEAIGQKIHKKLDNVVFTDAKISRKDHIKPLAFLYSSVKLGKKVFYIDPTTLFTRLIAMVQREENIEKYFEYEMTTLPIALFKDGMMRKPDKPALRKHLVDEIVPDSRGDGRVVLDGGALIHRVRWVKGETYDQTCNRYAKHVFDNYSNCTIVFDGYTVPSPKDHEHFRREGLGKTSSNITVTPTNKAHKSQEDFLNNTHNKQQFVHILSERLRELGHRVINCDDDADTIIAATAIEYASSSDVTVVADDTDVILLLVHHFQNSMKNVYFRSDKASKTWNVRDIVRHLSPVLKEHILFIHAWSGCDTTSAIFGQGKTSFCKKMKTSAKLQALSKRISDPAAAEDDVIQAGLQVFLHTYGGEKVESLTKLR